MIFFCSKHQTVSTYGTLRRVHLREVLSIHPQVDLWWYSWFQIFRPWMTWNFRLFWVGFFTMRISRCRIYHGSQLWMTQEGGEWPLRGVRKCLSLRQRGEQLEPHLALNRSGINASLGHRNSRKAVEVVEWYHDCSCFWSFPKVIWTATSSLITVFAARVSPYNSMWSRSRTMQEVNVVPEQVGTNRAKTHSQKRSLGGSVKGLNFQTLKLII